MLIVHMLAAVVLHSTVSANITFTAGLPFASKSTFVANPNAATADGSAAVQLTVTARDVYNNPVANSPISFAASGGNNTFSPSAGATDANGVLQASFKSTLAQSKTVTATLSGASTLTLNATFAPGAASATTSSFVINPNTTYANNNNTLTAVVTVLDAQGNPISGVTPSFAASGSSTTVTPSGATSASGQASASYQTSVAQNENATVSVAGLSFSAPIAFVTQTSTPSAAASSLIANPNIAAGNGAALISLVTTARDAQGTALSGVSVALSASGGNNTFASASGTTLSDGTYTTTLKSTQMQTETITALIGGSVTETTSVTFTGNANATTSTLTVNPNSQTVGPANLITATLTLRDAASNPLAAVAPTWTASGSTNTIASNGNTSASGVATATYSSTLAQSESAKVAVGGINLSANIKFVAGSPNMTTSYLYATPVRQLANNSNTIVATLMLLDAYYNGVSGQTATFSASGTATTVSGAATTNSKGLAQATYKSSTIQSENASVSAAGLNYTTPIYFTDIPTQCTLVVNPNNAAADGNSAMTLTASVTNSTSQPVANVQVIFASTGAAQNFAPQNVITTASGQASSSLTTLYSGFDMFSAKIANVQCASQGNFLTHAPLCAGNPNYALTTYPTDNTPKGVVASDFNGDGEQDLAVITRASDTLGIFFGTGSGTFQSQITYATGGFSFGIASDDLYGDGAPDLMVSNYYDKTLGVFINLGSGTFQNQVTYTTNSNPAVLTTGDFNGDGRRDVAVVNAGINSIGVLLGTGTGAFQAQVTYATGTNPIGISSGDSNADGKQDLAVTNQTDSTLSVYLGTGLGTFQTQVPYSTDGGPYSVVTGDFNGDGNQDLAVTNSASYTLGIFLGTGTGEFQDEVSYNTGSFPLSLAAGDFNGDGLQDLVVANLYGTSFGLFLGTGTGSFQSPLSYAAGAHPQGIAVADFNNDKRQDIALVNGNANTLGVYLQSCP